MTQQQICPHCRSVFELNGQLDFGAKALQVINCPVCGQEIWIPSGLWPQQWTVGKVIVRNYEPSPPIIVSTPSDINKTVWGDFSFTQPLKDLGTNISNAVSEPLKNLGQGAYKIGIWAVVILVLVFLILRQWKK